MTGPRWNEARQRKYAPASKASTTNPYRIPARTQPILAAGLTAAAIRPMPSTAPAAEVWVPTSWSRGSSDVGIRAAAAPPTRPMPMRSIPTVSSSLVMAGDFSRKTGTVIKVSDDAGWGSYALLGRPPQTYAPRIGASGRTQATTQADADDRTIRCGQL